MRSEPGHGLTLAARFPNVRSQKEVSMNRKLFDYLA